MAAVLGAFRQPDSAWVCLRLTTRGSGFRRRSGPSRGGRLRAICRRSICARLRPPLARLCGFRRRGWPVWCRRLRAICRWRICAGWLRPALRRWIWLAVRRRPCPTRRSRRGLGYRLTGRAGFRFMSRRPSPARRRSIPRWVVRAPWLTIWWTRCRGGRPIVRRAIAPIAAVTRTAVIAHRSRTVPNVRWTVRISPCDKDGAIVIDPSR